ncbi:hypothetical protein FRC17_009473 [Serendipita sp. 399]|nr:hypothetical protein FRC17_009473 [Serendipita sp. 399]
MPKTPIDRDELSTPNRIPSDQEISIINQIIAEDIKELSTLQSRIEKRQNLVDLSQKTVDDIKATLEYFKSIQLARKKQLEKDIVTQQELNSAAALRVQPNVPQKAGYEVPKLEDINAYHVEQLEKCRLRVQEGVNEVDRSNKWRSELCQRQLECRSRLVEETHSLDAMKRCAFELRSQISL